MGLIIASALFVGLTSLCVLIWTLSSGQYDDLDGDAQRILLDDDLDQSAEIVSKKADAKGQPGHAA